MKKYCLYFILITFIFLTSCASEGTTVTDSKGKYISFTLSVKGQLKGDAYYCILLNSESTKIQVDDVSTFTDVIRFYHPSEMQPSTFIWYHKANPTDQILTYITELDIYASVSEDGSTITYTFPVDNNSVVFNNYIPNLFTAQALITNTNGGELGRFIDCMGPDLSSSTLYTIAVDKTKGPIGSLLPAGYPNDRIGDCESSNISSNTPYDNVDITSFRIFTY